MRRNAWSRDRGKRTGKIGDLEEEKMGKGRGRVGKRGKGNKRKK